MVARAVPVAAAERRGSPRLPFPPAANPGSHGINRRRPGRKVPDGAVGNLKEPRRSGDRRQKGTMKTDSTQHGGGTQHRVVGHLHCPFCGSLNLDVHEPCHIGCGECGATGPDFCASATAAWCAWDARAHADCIADFQRVVEWAKSKNRKPANLAFTAGPERQAAYWIEWAKINMPNPSRLGTTAVNNHKNEETGHE